MDTFRKWLNKPKADDKSLLARFYHADRSLTAVASELDSFDGRAEPDRCSRLVSRLRQGQDKVLAITNLIMDELLGEDRDPRSFRVKFPEEVLQENLAGQLWFGAECLAAGSSIMNREQESKEMRPLAQAVTKSLGNVRNLLREQCFRSNVPNSKTLHLDVNDSTTEQLYESLKIFDRLFAEFELRYVSAMVQVKTKQEYEMQELICVLFSETLQRALKLGLLEQDKVDAFDPALMFSIPRLAIICGLVIYHKGPLNMEMPADQMSEMFRPFRTILIKIRDLLRTLSKKELFQLEKLLCINEDIQITIPLGTSSIEAPSTDQQNNNNNNCDESSTTTTTTSNVNEQRNNNNNVNTINPTITTAAVDMQTPNATTRKNLRVASGGTHTTETYASRYARRSPSISSFSAYSTTASTPTASPVGSPSPSHSIVSSSSEATSPAEWSDDDTDGDEAGSPKELDMVSADCASGYLIPNTNLGNLLQPQEVPLTDNFIASEDEFSCQQQNTEDENEYNDLPTTSAAVSARSLRLAPPVIDTQNESIHSTPRTSLRLSDESIDRISANNSRRCSQSGSSKSNQTGSSTTSCNSTSSHRHHHRRSSNSSNHENTCNAGTVGSGSSRTHHHHHHHHKLHRHTHHHHHHRNHNTVKRNSLDVAKVEAVEQIAHDDTTAVSPATNTKPAAVKRFTSSGDSSTSSSFSDGDSHEVSIAVRAAGRIKFKSTENLLHRLFVCIAGVADQLQTNFAADLRHILRSVFLMNMSPAQEDIDIPEKAKESDLFEFRASENDVIQESAGSNQSIYSAEEVNPELDNVFNGSSNNGNVRSTHNSTSSSSSSIQRGNTIDLGCASAVSSSVGDNVIENSNNGSTVLRNPVGRSRSLGDQEQNESQVSYTNSSNSRISTYRGGTSSVRSKLQQSQRNRNNSVGSNSPSSSSSESNSPISERASNGYTLSSRHNANINDASLHQLPTNACVAPPAWIPDDKAPRCMSCRTPFTAFRRRHHCRNCGGVFCGVCSNASAPLPKYGLTKAVRVCRDCYLHEVHASTAENAGRHATSANVTTSVAGS